MTASCVPNSSEGLKISVFYEIGTLGFARRDCYEGYVPIYRQVSKYRLCCGEEFKSYHPSVKVLIVSRVALTEYTLLIHFGVVFGSRFLSRHFFKVVRLAASSRMETFLDCYSVQFLKSWQFDRYARLESTTPCSDPLPLRPR